MVFDSGILQKIIIYTITIIYNCVKEYVYDL